MIRKALIVFGTVLGLCLCTWLAYGLWFYSLEDVWFTIQVLFWTTVGMILVLGWCLWADGVDRRDRERQWRNRF